MSKARCKAALRKGEPCSHPGCLSHTTHPCEGCGRVAGGYISAGIPDPRESVQEFALDMERKLMLNDHKGGWENCTLSYLMALLEDEVRELDLLIRSAKREDSSKLNAEQFLGETADIGNFAMMIADNIRKGRSKI